MTDDEPTSITITCSLDQEARWELTAAASEIPLERWITFTLDARAAIIASRLTGEYPPWWEAEYG